ncbi:glycerol-1-phosphate dehydrogenase [NAD(P)+] [Spirochaetia bacterium]|nr:glycerol-1-phosphate dehydrogenase [NAD(P)+] [Spirochaetia bacterium]
MSQQKLSLEVCLDAASETEALLLGENTLEQIPTLARRYFQFSTACIIADENTNNAAGNRVRDMVTAAGIPLAEPFIFPGSPRLHAEIGHCARIEAHLKALPGYPAILPIAVGSGTVNDLVKRAAGELALPYLCVPTAASVDGYTSYGAALLSDGFKQTFPCPAPRVLAADTTLLRSAPAYLNSSGFGDLAGKLIAGTDWIIAEKAGALGAPGTEPIEARAWAMTQNGLPETLQSSVDAVRGDGEGVRTLFAALAVTGFAMQYLRSSRPVSGCEHLWSHVWEMEDLSVDGVPVTHGHKVALGTLAAAAFTECLFASAEPPAPRKRPSRAEREAEVRTAFAHIAIANSENTKGAGSKAADAAVKTSLEKYLDEPEAAALADGLRDNWKPLREAVLAKLTPYGELRSLLAKGGCPVSPAELGLTRNAVIATARRAQMIRNRYTALDLAWDLGIFEDVLARLEGDAGYL